MAKRKKEIEVTFSLATKKDRKAFVLAKFSTEMAVALNEIYNTFEAEKINEITRKHGFDDKDIRYYAGPWIKEL